MGIPFLRCDHLRIVSGKLPGTRAGWTVTEIQEDRQRPTGNTQVKYTARPVTFVLHQANSIAKCSETLMIKPENSAEKSWSGCQQSTETSCRNKALKWDVMSRIRGPDASVEHQSDFNRRGNRGSLGDEIPLPSSARIPCSRNSLNKFMRSFLAVSG